MKPLRPWSSRPKMRNGLPSGVAILKPICKLPEVSPASWRSRLSCLRPGQMALSSPTFSPSAMTASRSKWNFVNPQRQVSLNENVPLDERIIALMCRRIVEMDVPEYMTRIIAMAENEPWEYYVAMTRQLWDEVRHAMLGEIYFESRGVDWRRLIAIHPGMSIRLGTLDVKDAHNVLYAIEQNLMPALTGKKLEYQISINADDTLASAIQDYDWADEVLHVHIGRQWLLPKLDGSPQESVEHGWKLRASTVHALDAYEQNGD